MHSLTISGRPCNSGNDLKMLFFFSFWQKLGQAAHAIGLETHADLRVCQVVMRLHGVMARLCQNLQGSGDFRDCFLTDNGRQLGTAASGGQRGGEFSGLGQSGINGFFKREKTGGHILGGGKAIIKHTCLPSAPNGSVKNGEMC